MKIHIIGGFLGSGKTTFLNMIGGLDRPSAGKLYVDGKNLFSMTDKELETAMGAHEWGRTE